MLRSQPIALCICMVLTLGLAACGGGDDGPDKPASQAAEGAPPSSAGKPVRAPSADEAQAPKPAQVDVRAFKLADGPDVCFRAIAERLGADAKVSEITSFFSVGKEIDASHVRPAGEMMICFVEYQDPNDPRKLLRGDLDLESGELGPPSQVEITVTGGNAADFNLEEYVIPLSKVDAAALSAVMDAQKNRLNGVYGRYAWSGVRLSAPGAFSNTHTLRLDVAGRLASNDLRQGGYASISVDGKKIMVDHLMP